MKALKSKFFQRTKALFLLFWLLRPCMVSWRRKLWGRLLSFDSKILVNLAQKTSWPALISQDDQLSASFDHCTHDFHSFVYISFVKWVYGTGPFWTLKKLIKVIFGVFHCGSFTRRNVCCGAREMVVFFQVILTWG